MAEMPLQRCVYRDYARTLAILQAFTAHTRERVARAVKNQEFTHDLVESVCMCKFLGTSFGIDCISVLRKTLGARALQKDANLGAESLLPNATAAAEGDNTIMEMKIVGDIVKVCCMRRLERARTCMCQRK